MWSITYMYMYLHLPFHPHNHHREQVPKIPIVRFPDAAGHKDP